MDFLRRGIFWFCAIVLLVAVMYNVPAEALLYSQGVSPYAQTQALSGYANSHSNTQSNAYGHTPVSGYGSADISKKLLTNILLTTGSLFEVCKAQGGVCTLSAFCSLDLSNGNYGYAESAVRHKHKIPCNATFVCCLPFATVTYKTEYDAKHSAQSGYGQGHQSGYGQKQSSGYGNSQPSGYGKSQPSGYGNIQPSAYGNNQPSAYGNIQPSGYGNSQPSAHGNSQPPAYRNSQPSAHGSSQPSAYGNIQPSAHENSPPSAYGNIQPSAHGNSQPSAYGQTKRSGSGQIKPAIYGASKPTGYGQTQPTAVFGQTQSAGYGKSQSSIHGLNPPSAYGQQTNPGSNQLTSQGYSSKPSSHASHQSLGYGHSQPSVYGNSQAAGYGKLPSYMYKQASTGYSLKNLIPGVGANVVKDNTEPISQYGQNAGQHFKFFGNGVLGGHNIYGQPSALRSYSTRHQSALSRSGGIPLLKTKYASGQMKKFNLPRPTLYKQPSYNFNPQHRLPLNTRILGKKK